MRDLACLSGAVSLDSISLDNETVSTAPAAGKTPPDLHTQLEAILDSVWREERMWRLESRIQGSLGRDPGNAPRNRPE